MVSLAAAIGVPSQAPDRGILPAFIIAAVVVFSERWIAVKTYRNQSFEKFSQGNIDMLVKDAVMDLKTLKKVCLTRKRLLAQLRALGIKHLGLVKRFYMEANESFTLIKEESPNPGLSIIPEWDTDFEAGFGKSESLVVCKACGFLNRHPFDLQSKCPHCGNFVWTGAVE